MGIGDWGLGIGDWGLGPIPNPQSPIPMLKNNFCNIKINKKIKLLIKIFNVKSLIINISLIYKLSKISD